MQPKPAHWSELPEGTKERLYARIALIARNDTIDGGASAMVHAKLPCDDAETLQSIVADVYSASTGKHHHQYEAWSCPECGSVHLGVEAALNCCAIDLDAIGNGWGSEGMAD